MSKNSNPDASVSTVKYFEFVDGKSSKFWEIGVSGKTVTVRYGKIGTTGQSLIKEFDERTQATENAEKQIAEKVGKGYAQRSAELDEQKRNNNSVISVKSIVKTQLKNLSVKDALINSF